MQKHSLPPARFGEALRIVQDKLDSRNFYAFNPEFDCIPGDIGCGSCPSCNTTASAPSCACEVTPDCCCNS